MLSLFEEGGVSVFLYGKNIRSQIKSMITAQGWTITDVVAKMNESRSPDKQTTIQNISNKLTRGTIKFSEVMEIAIIIGCRLSWEPLSTEEVPSDE